MYDIHVEALLNVKLVGKKSSLCNCFYALLQDDQIKQSQDKVVKTIEKRSLLPRIVYLSIQCASSSVKGSVEANGSVFDPKLSSELRLLLERYANILGFSFQDAVGHAFDISSGLNDAEVNSCVFTPCEELRMLPKLLIFVC